MLIAWLFIALYLTMFVQTPGPGTYEVTDQKVYKMRNPAYSLTSRNDPPGDTTMKPGPGAHSPEKVYNNNNIFIQRPIQIVAMGRCTVVYTL